MTPLEAAKREVLDAEARFASLLSAAKHPEPHSEAAVNRWVRDAERDVAIARIRLATIQADEA